MKIFIMRHGEAEVFAQSDETRSLTDFGQSSSLQQGIWLKTQLKFTAVDKVLVSPYVRAQQTFEQVNAAFEQQLTPIRENWEAITPYGNAEVVASYLAVLAQQGVENLLIISHLPLVSDIVLELCGKNNVAFLPATIAEVHWQPNQIGKIMQGKKP